MQVKIDVMTDAQLAEEYTKLLNKADKIKSRTVEVRDSIIEKAKSGIEFKGLGVTVSERFSYNYTLCAEVYEKQTGKKVPTRVIPKQTVMDVDLLKVLIKREGIVEGTKGYTVKREKTKKKK